jgi:hypothetical protein
MHFPEECQKLTFRYIPSALSLEENITSKCSDVS